MSEKPPETPKPFGRPPEYRPEYCQKLIEHMSEGFSFESFAAVIDVHRDTLYEWAKVYPDFSDVKKMGKDKALLWWEKEGKKGLREKNFNATVYVWSTKNICKWTDRHNIDVKSSTKKLSGKTLDQKILAAKEAIKFLEAQKQKELQASSTPLIEGELQDVDGVPV
jgi:hypothetical protein